LNEIVVGDWRAQTSANLKDDLIVIVRTTREKLLDLGGH
jgi:hypothetical protein